MDNTQQSPEIEYIASLPSKSEVKSWERKCIALAKLLELLAPIDEQILEIIRERQPLINDIEDLRGQMTQECIHPKEHLIDLPAYVLCKFCERKLVIPNGPSET